MIYGTPPVLTYFPIRGRAEPIRLLLEDAQIKYEDHRNFNWQQEKPNRDKYPFGQLPAMSFGPLHIVQQDAILRHLAREHNYYGTLPEEMADADMIAGAVEDLKGPYGRAIYGGDFENAVGPFLEKNAKPWLDNIHYFLQRHNNGEFYITGQKITYADFLLYEMLVVLTYLDANILKGYPLLDGYVKRISYRPHIAEYLASGRRPLQVNGVKFGTPKEFLAQMEANA